MTALVPEVLPAPERHPDGTLKVWHWTPGTRVETTRLELRGHRGPGKAWRLGEGGRRYLAPARTWDGDGRPVYRPIDTLVPAARKGPAVVFSV